MTRVSRLAVTSLVAALALTAGAPRAGATFPGQNGRIAFMGPGPADIFSANPDGTGLTRLTSDPAQDVHPAWSPDGARIAFASDRVRGNGQTDIYVMNADGTDVTRLTSAGPSPGSSVSSFLPAWSPDGASLAFVSDVEDPRGDVYVMNADGTGQVNLTRSAGLDSHPAWSPDGRRLAFVSDRGGNEQLYTMDPDGGRQTRLTSDDGTPKLSLDWSPDGTQLVFERAPGVAWVVRADGTGARRVADGMAPVWSPDGTRILFTIVGPRTLATVRPDGTGFTALPIAGDYADWQRLPAPPRRDDFRNASQFCKALLAFLGASAFGERYRNHGTCVRANR